MKVLALGVIQVYQLTLSRVLASSCRFTPSCSHYAHESIERYGIVRGGWMAVKRLARCHPWHEGGYDPVV